VVERGSSEDIQDALLRIANLDANWKPSISREYFYRTETFIEKSDLERRIRIQAGFYKIWFLQKVAAAVNRLLPEGRWLRREIVSRQWPPKLAQHSSLTECRIDTE
jgi:hypothetical protein